MVLMSNFKHSMTLRDHLLCLLWVTASDSTRLNSTGHGLKMYLKYVQCNSVEKPKFIFLVHVDVFHVRPTILMNYLTRIE